MSTTSPRSVSAFLGVGATMAIVLAALAGSTATTAGAEPSSVITAAASAATTVGAGSRPATPVGLPPGFTDSRVAGGSSLPLANQLTLPTSLAFLPDGDLLVTEQSGVLRLVHDGVVEPTPVLDLSKSTDDDEDSGMIDVAVDPDFLTNHYIYVLYTHAGPRVGLLARFTMRGNTADPASERIVLRMTAYVDGHAVDTVKFGPDDTVYVSDGDSSRNGGTVHSTLAQVPSDTEGKIFHIYRDGRAVPTNPWYDKRHPYVTASKVLALGFRNPFRFAVTSSGVVLVGDVGWSTWEEIDQVTPGIGNHDYGWPCYEGAPVQPAFSSWPICVALLKKGPSAVTAPVYAYNHDGSSAAVVGGPVYTGATFPASYDGAYLFGDYVRGYIDVWPRTATGRFVGQPRAFDTMASSPVDIEVAPDGSVFYVSINLGEIREISYHRYSHR